MVAPARFPTLPLPSIRAKFPSMSQTPDWDNAWEGLEPQQPRPRRGCYQWAMATAIVLALAVAALAVFARQRGANDAPGLVLPGTGTPATTESEATAAPIAEATAAGPGLAPTATLPGEMATPELPPASDVVAARFAPILDGDPSDWADLPVYTSPFTVFTSDTWDGTDDLDVSWHVGWDDVFLYFSFTVMDETHAQSQSGNQMFRGDSVELQIDTDRAGDYGPALSVDDYQAILSPGDLGSLRPSAWLFQGTTDGNMLDAPRGTNIVVVARQTADGYTMEAAVPWIDLGVTPAPGLVLGLAVNANDNDRPGVAAQEVMKSNIPSRRHGDPTTWGTVTLQ